MKKCTKCGKVHENNDMIYCNSCGGTLEHFDGEKRNLCPGCNNTILPGARFCNVCGRPSESGAPINGREFYDRYSAPRKMVETRSNKKIMALLTILIILVLVLVVAVVAMIAVRTDVDGIQQTNSVAVKDKAESKPVADTNTTKEEKTEDSENTENTPSSEGTAVQEEPAPQPAPQPKPVQPAPQPKPVEPPAPTKYEIEVSIDNYVQSFVLAMNYGDSSYMLDYVIPNSPIYRTQKEFIKNNWYEEYVDSYLVSDVTMENSNTCVVSAYEIYNVQRTGEVLKRTEQTATYRMKRDSDGYWKVYDFVGSVKTH